MGKIICKRNVALCFAICFLVGAAGNLLHITKAEGKDVHRKTYIVKTKTDKQYKNEMSRNKCFVNDEYNMLSDENIIVADLTQNDVQRLDGKVEYMEEDIIVEASKKKNQGTSKSLNKKQTRSTNDNSDWNLDMIHATDKLAKSAVNDVLNTDRIRVAVLDSGVDYCDSIDVDEFINLVPGEEEVSPLFADTTGHGTSIAGIIAAHSNEDNNIVGINPNAQIISIKVLDDDNMSPISRVIEGIYCAIDREVNIINMSFGTNTYSDALKDAIDVATEHGILVIAAAGNTGANVQYPAALEKVVSVGSVASSGKVSETSAVGKQVDISAPGEDIKSVGFFGGEVIVSGTSMSVPHVVGVASVLWQKDRSQSAEFISGLLKVSANQKTNDNNILNGIVDLDYALSIYDDYKEKYMKNHRVSDIFNGNNSLREIESDTSVIGSWTKTQHEDLAQSYTSNISKDKKIAHIIKVAATYADKNDGFSKMSKNPWWHGFYQLVDDNKKFKCLNNYFASYIYITQCALEDKLGSNERINGLSKSIKEGIDHDLTKFNNDGNNDEITWTNVIGNIIGSSEYKIADGNTKKEYRRAFLWGLALHSATDIYSHSSFEKKDGAYSRISHESDFNKNKEKDADDPAYQEIRYEAAHKTAEIVLDNYKKRVRGDVTDFFSGLLLVADVGKRNLSYANVFPFASQVNQKSSAREIKDRMEIINYSENKVDLKVPVADEFVYNNASWKGFDFTCELFDETGLWDAKLYIWTEKNGADDMEVCDIKATGKNQSVSYHVDASTHNNETGVYNIHVYAYDVNGNMRSYGGTTKLDNKAPTVYQFDYANVTEKGFSFSCKAYDEFDVTRLECKVWTEKNGQDDLKCYDMFMTNDGGWYNFSASNHNGETGKYIIHVYAYDSAGNVQSYGTEVSLSDTQAPLVNDYRYANVTNNGFSFSCQVRDNIGVKNAVAYIWREDTPSDVRRHDLFLSGETAWYNFGNDKNFYRSGKYTIHVYAYDNAGNSQSYGTSVLLP